MFTSSLYSNVSFLLPTTHALILYQTMQTIETYTPSLPNLHLTPFQSANTIVDNVHPLNYRLTPDDFITFTLPSGQLLYALDPATGTSLWWALRRIARVITRAAVHSIPINPTLPVAQRAYIPQFQFDRIAMQRPAVLSALDPDCMNPLYGYTSRENIQAWFIDFQNMGRQAVQWIRTARTQSAYLGIYSGWNWDGFSRDISNLEFPNRYLIKGPEGKQSSSLNVFPLLTKVIDHVDRTLYTVPSVYDSSISESSSESNDGSFTYDEDTIMEEAEGGMNSILQSEELILKKSLDNRSMVLHPVLSAYVKRYQDYNVFSKEPLINNGYVERDAGDITPYPSALSPLESTTFQILSLPGAHNN